MPVAAQAFGKLAAMHTFVIIDALVALLPLNPPHRSSTKKVQRRHSKLWRSYVKSIRLSYHRKFRV